MEELISVIVPIYKVEKYLKKCIDSIINQTYQNLEIILVDDGSPDNCGKICDEYAQKDKRIVVIHKENGGQSEARNLALDIAKGKYIAFVDSDDYIKEDMIEILYKNIMQYEGEIAICNIIKVKKDIREKVEDYSELEIYDKSNTMQQLLKHHITNYLTNKLYKRELWNQIRLPVGRILEDMDVMYKLIEKASKIICTNKTEYYYYIREDSSISEISAKVTKDLKEAVDRRYEYLSSRMPEVSDLLNITKLENVIQYHDNLAYCKEKKLYKSQEFKEEYQFYKKHFFQYKKELLSKRNIRKRLEAYLLYFNRELYYLYARIRTKIKQKRRGI